MQEIWGVSIAVQISVSESLNPYNKHKFTQQLQESGSYTLTDGLTCDGVRSGIFTWADNLRLKMLMNDTN